MHAGECPGASDAEDHSASYVDAEPQLKSFVSKCAYLKEIDDCKLDSVEAAMCSKTCGNRVNEADTPPYDQPYQAQIRNITVFPSYCQWYKHEKPDNCDQTFGKVHCSRTCSGLGRDTAVPASRYEAESNVWTKWVEYASKCEFFKAQGQCQVHRSQCQKTCCDVHVSLRTKALLEKQLDNALREEQLEDALREEQLEDALIEEDESTTSSVGVKVGQVAAVPGQPITSLDPMELEEWNKPGTVPSTKPYRVKVTCEFAVHGEVLSVFLGGKDITGTVQGDLTDKTGTKTVEFEPEPFGAKQDVEPYLVITAIDTGDPTVAQPPRPQATNLLPKKEYEHPSCICGGSPPDTELGQGADVRSANQTGGGPTRESGHETVHL